MRLGARIVNNWIWRLGFACRFLWVTLKESGPSFRRFHLTIREIYFTGVMSLVIILVSGLFVGMVLGLQGYDTLVRLRLRRGARGARQPFAGARAWPGRRRTALCQPRGQRDHRRDRIDESNRAAFGDGDDGGGSHRPRGRAPFLGRSDFHALARGAVSAMGVFGGYLVGVRLIGVDEGSFWSQMQAAVDFRQDVLNGVIKSLVFGVAVTWIAVYEGYDAPPTAEGVSGATTRTVVTSSLAILALDFVLTALMFRGL